MIQKAGDVIIIDETVPFDNGLDAFEAARKSKIEKYSNVAQEMSLQGKNVVLEAIVARTLGSWDPANDRVMKRICSRRYLSTFKNIAVSEKISFS